MIKYKSTRGEKKKYSFLDSVLKGIGSDGGLLVPEKIPLLSKNDLEKLVDSSYQQLALFVLKLFETGIKDSVLRKILKNAYSVNFGSSDIVPVKKITPNIFVSELWHGPTAVFKDIALQLMPYFFEEAIKKDKKTQYLILAATSGDTGGAALSGFKDRKGVSMITFYPEVGLSSIQKLQMTTENGKNTLSVSATGDFDEIQSSVKEVFNNAEFNSLLQSKNIALSSANSINWGRLLPQIIYHFYAYLALVRKEEITLCEKINLSVPTGNFGNILAGYIAKKMGLPINKLICSTNENDVLVEFFKTGVYDIKDRKLIHTTSPAMDILNSSNIERLLYFICKDTKLIQKWMTDLSTQDKFQVDNQTLKILKTEFYAGWVSNSSTIHTMKHIFEQSNESYLIDPHTAVGVSNAEQFLDQENENEVVLVTSTAHWSKFPKEACLALCRMNKNCDKDFDTIRVLLKNFPKLSLPKSIRYLRKRKIKKALTCSATREAMQDLILDFVKV